MVESPGVNEFGISQRGDVKSDGVVGGTENIANETLSIYKVIYIIFKTLKIFFMIFNFENIHLGQISVYEFDRTMLSSWL